LNEALFDGDKVLVYQDTILTNLLRVEEGLDYSIVYAYADTTSVLVEYPVTVVV
jgi:hypothetical protein